MDVLNVRCVMDMLNFGVNWRWKSDDPIGTFVFPQKFLGDAWRGAGDV